MNEHSQKKLQELAFVFTQTKTFKAWRYLTELKKVFYKDRSVSQSLAKPFSEAWIKKELIPSKAFRLWQKFWRVRSLFYNKLKMVLQPVENFIRKNAPAPLKKYLKIFLRQLRRDKSIEGRLLQELTKVPHSNFPGCADIIIFGVIAYDYRIQRPQHLATELANRGHRVFYIENEFHHVHKFQQATPTIEKKQENLYLVKLAAPEEYFIYNDVPSKKGTNILFSSFKEFLRMACITNPIAKIDHPFWSVLMDRLSMPIIYDLMDEHSGFTETGKKIHLLENKLLKDSDIVLAASDYLFEKSKKIRPEKSVVLLKNAGEYAHFSSSSRLKRDQHLQDIASIKGPIAGYYGAIDSWFDDKLLEYTLQKMPDISFVLIGRVSNTNILSLAKKYSNLHLLGEKSYEILPLYLQYFDICLIPFVINNLIKATNPVKVYEYFSAGKPVVATLIPELFSYKDALYLSSTPKQFVSLINDALAEESVKLQERRRKIARKNTWEVRANVLDHEIRALLFPPVSIITLVKDNAVITKKMLRSVLANSLYPNFELIIVNNNSDIKTTKIIEEIAKDNRVKVIFNKKNYGFAKGNNQGFKKAKGDYFIIINNDVLITPGWISRLLYHYRSKDAGLVGPVTNSIGNESQINIQYDIAEQSEFLSRARDYMYKHWGEFLVLNNIAAFCWIQSRDLYERIGGFDESFGRGLFEDDDYCKRVNAIDKKIYCIDDCFIHHYGGATTQWNSPEYAELFQKNKEIFEKKWGKWIPHRYRRGVM